MRLDGPIPRRLFTLIPALAIFGLASSIASVNVWGSEYPKVSMESWEAEGEGWNLVELDVLNNQGKTSRAMAFESKSERGEDFAGSIRSAPFEVTHWRYGFLLAGYDGIPPDHEDSYSLSKYCCELNCEAWTNRTGMTTAAFRFAGVFPPEWTESYKDQAKPTEEWPGELANYVDLRDMVDGLVKAVECETLPKSGVYQFAAPDTTLPEPTMEIIERFRPELLKVIREPMPGRTTMLSNKRANETFGYDPQHHWKEI